MNTTLVVALLLLAVGAAIVIQSLRMCSEW